MVKKTKEIYKNLEEKFLKLAGDVGGFLKKKGKQSINLLKRTTGGVADFLTGGVFDFDKKGEGITDNVLMGNKLAAQGFKGIIDNMNIGSSAKAGTLDEFIAGGGVLPENEPKIELSGASKELIGDDKPFLKAIEDLSEKRGINQSELLGLIASESSFDPKAVNKDTGATGLIQFMPEVAESLGTTTDEIREMRSTEQVKLIDKYFDMNKLPDNPTAGQLKTNVLMLIYTDKSDDFELMTKNKQFTDGEQSKYIFSKSGLDSNKDGFITIGDGRKCNKKNEGVWY